MVNTTTAQRKAVCLVWGDNPAPYHPLRAVSDALGDILAPEFDCRFSTATTLESDDMRDASLVLVYIDRWDTLVDQATVQALETHVARGGGILTLHNGISLARNPIARWICGATFREHPAMETMEFMQQAPQGTRAHQAPGPEPGFRLHEEPYRYDFDPRFTCSVFLEYAQGEQNWPAGWTISSPGAETSGKLAVLMPGHHRPVFDHPAYRNLLLSIARGTKSNRISSAP